MRKYNINQKVAQQDELSASESEWVLAHNNDVRPNEYDKIVSELFAGPRGISPSNDNTPGDDLIVTSGDLVAAYRPPNFLVDGIFQRRYLYAITAPSGWGKTAVAQMLAAHVALGNPLGEIEVEQGRVLYLAGENPDDMLTRWIALSEQMGFDPVKVPVDFVNGSFNLENKIKRIQNEARTKARSYSMVIVDTCQAYFSGEDDNKNTDMLKYAQTLRELMALPGGPCVLVLCHPVKHGDQHVPKGGGAFLNEIDGNTYLSRHKHCEEVMFLTQHQKFRGPEFKALPFEMVKFNAPRLKDAKGRPVGSVMAVPLTRAVVAAEQDVKNILLSALQQNPGARLWELAKAIGLENPKASAATSQISRELDHLAKEHLAEKRDKKWFLTLSGEKALVSKTEWVVGDEEGEL